MASFNDGDKNHVFNRSLTIHNSCDFSKKNINLDRLSSVKKLNNSSSFGSSMVSTGFSIKGKVKKLCSFFERPPKNSTDFKSRSPSPSPSPLPSPKRAPNPDSLIPSIRLPGTEDRVVIFFTSLRGIRKTYTDCFAIRMIFKGFRVNIDERDISMDNAYRKELQSLLGEKNVTLPQVFIKGKYIGGADVVKQLNETGELAKMLKGVPIRSIKPGFSYICEGCGDLRFIPCSNCSGSRKVFDEEDDQLKRCPVCNENGLIRCPECCY